MAALNEQLIESVKAYPILYDFSHEDYKNFRKRDKVWDEIGRILKQDSQVVKSKWRNMRDSFAKFLKAKKNYKNWQWAAQMEHFRPFLTSKVKSISTEECDFEELNEDTSEAYIKIEKSQIMYSGEEDNETSEVPVERTPSPPNTENGSVKRTTRRYTKKADNKRANESSVDTVMEYLERRRINNNNSIDLIFRGYAEALKHFSPKRQAYTKLKVAEIITQQEMEQQEEDLLKFQNNCSN